MALTIAEALSRQYSALQQTPNRISGLSNKSSLLSAQDALVAVMIATSASDRNIKTSELVCIEALVDGLPAFADYDKSRFQRVSRTVLDLFEENDGLDVFFDLIRSTLPARMFETAYALACDVAAADGRLEEDQLIFLREIRYELSIDRLAAAAIERGARARHLTP